MTTRAAVCRAPGRPWEITDLELDEPKANEVRIKFHAAGLCHSDDHIQKGDARMRMPVVGGHEGAGVIDAVGEGVNRHIAYPHGTSKGWSARPARTRGSVRCRQDGGCLPKGPAGESRPDITQP